MEQIGTKTRAMNRHTWRIFHRMLRIIQRESRKASTDMLIYGTGVVHIGAKIPDGIRHIPFEEWIDNAPNIPRR